MKKLENNLIFKLEIESYFAVGLRSRIIFFFAFYFWLLIFSPNGSGALLIFFSTAPTSQPAPIPNPALTFGKV